MTEIPTPPAIMTTCHMCAQAIVVRVVAFCIAIAESSLLTTTAWHTEDSDAEHSKSNLELLGYSSSSALATAQIRKIQVLGSCYESKLSNDSCAIEGMDCV